MLSVTLAQINRTAGDITGSIEIMCCAAAHAAEAGAAMILVPELVARWGSHAPNRQLRLIVRRTNA